MKDYTAEELKKLKRSEPEFAAPYERFLNYLFPIESERHVAASWATTLMACPGAKLPYAQLLFSETTGVGKTTFGDIIAAVLGIENFIVLEASGMIGDGDSFTHWSEKQLVVINEINEGYSLKVSERLKEIITDKSIRVRKMHQMGYTAKNFLNDIACSNSPRALHLTSNDRRW